MFIFFFFHCCTKWLINMGLLQQRRIGAVFERVQTTLSSSNLCSCIRQYSPKQNVHSITLIFSSFMVPNFHEAVPKNVFTLCGWHKSINHVHLLCGTAVNLLETGDVVNSGLDEKFSRPRDLAQKVKGRNWKLFKISKFPIQFFYFLFFAPSPI